MKKLFQSIICTSVCASMLTPMTPALASAGDGLSMQRPDNLHGIGSADWTVSDVIFCSGTGDLFALSDSVAAEFVYETNAEFTASTGAASLVFFAGDDPARGSYVANIDLGAGNARIFRFEQNGSATTKGEYKLTAEQRKKRTFHLRVEVSANEIVYFIDQIPVIHVQDSSTKAGYRLGLLTYNTRINYTDLGYAPLSSAYPTLSILHSEYGTLTPSLKNKLHLPYGTTEFALTAVAEGNLRALTTGGNATVQGNVISITDVTTDLQLIIQVVKGSVYRSYWVDVKVEADSDTLYNEQYRPQFHFSPLQNWLNDPNGLVYDPSNETWHLFFQYNPYGLNIANQVWGHAVSTDLLHWKELDVAIPQDHLGAVFSGSAVVDEHNTSGFFTDNLPGESKLVALYTADGGDTAHGVEKQCVAYSKDHGVTWIKPQLGIDANIVISNDGNQYGRDFRDPKIFCYDGKWFMVIAGGRARLFASDNLIDWTRVCDMGFDSECPDFYPLPVDGDETNVKWVFNASGKWYVVGRLEKISENEYRFVQEGDRITYNGGSEVYATQSFFNDGSSQNRRIAISWIQDNSANSLAGKNWNGAMTLPYEQSLRTVNGKIILTSYPVAEVDTLKGGELLSWEKGSDTSAVETLESVSANVYDLQMIFTPEKGSILTLAQRMNGTHKVEVVYDYDAKMLRVIRGRASAASGNIPTSTMEMPLYPDTNGQITLRILMDTTVIEVFGNNGEAALCGMIFPDEAAIHMELSLGGNVEIDQLQLWKLKSAWHAEEEILPASGIYFEVRNDSEDFNEKSVTAYFLTEQGNRITDGVQITAIQSDAVQIKQQEQNRAIIAVTDSGKLTLTATYGKLTKSVTMILSPIGFDTNLEGWTSAGDWYEGEGGLSIAGSNGDSFVFSSGTNQSEFNYTGIADFHGQSGCLGLVFGTTNPNNPKSGTWYGANVDTHGSQTVIKLFCNTNGNEVWNQTLTIASASTYTLTVTYQDGTLNYTVNGKSVSKQVRRLEEGALGLVSWNGGGSFNQVNYAPIEDDSEPDKPIVPDAPSADNQPPVTQTPDIDQQSQTNAPSSWLVPVLLGAGALIVVGAVVGLLIIRKNKSK